MEPTRPAPSDPSRAAIEHLARGVQELHPAYFALVMATGIVSLASDALGLGDAARFLFFINVPAYAVVWALFTARAILFPRQFVADLRSHQRGPGFFTSIAATCVLGVQCAVLFGDLRTASALWWLAMALWCACTYGIFVLLSVREAKPSLGEGMNGGWLLAVVSTQSLCVLGCKVLPARFPQHDGIFLLLASLWLCGGMLYVWMISLIFYRYMFFQFSRSDLLPPYWINMGAVAISTLAGTALSAAATQSPLLRGLLPFVSGLTLLFWATATWWIPMLVLLGIWRHRVPSCRIVYDPLYWGLVFPLGMYALATHRLGQLHAVAALGWIAKGVAIVSLCAWLLTFFGMTTRLLYLVLLWLRSVQAHRSTVETGPALPER